MDRNTRRRNIINSLTHYGFTRQQATRPNWIDIANRLNITIDRYPNPQDLTRGQRNYYARLVADRTIERYNNDIIPVVQNYSFTYYRRKKSDRGKEDKWEKQVYRGSVETTNQYLDGFLEDDYNHTVEFIQGASDYDYKDFTEPVRGVKTILNRARGGAIIPIAKGIKAVRMRKAGYNIDKKFIGDSSWDTKKDTCVLDWIYYRYGDTKGFKKVMPKDDKNKSYEWLKNLFELENITDGVSINMITQRFCNLFRIPLYCYDIEENTISYFKPIDTNFNHEPLMFIIANEHFYPIQDKKKRLSLSTKSSNEKKETYSSMFREIENYEKKEEKEEKEYEVVSPELPVDENDWAIDKICEKNTLPEKNTIVMDGNTIKRFKLGDTIYITNPIENEVKEYYGNNFKGQSKNSILLELWKETYGKDIYEGDHTSSFSPTVMRELLKKGVKDRVHYGATRDLKDLLEKIEIEETEEIIKEKVIIPENPQLNKYFDYEIKPKTVIEKTYIVKNRETVELEKLFNKGKVEIVDIAKAHSNCLYNPMSEWLKFDIDDEIEPYTGEKIVNGLYFVETNDMTLLHKSNWYSSEIVKLAMNNKIELNITRKIVCKKILPKEYFRPIMDNIKEKTGPYGLTKELNNKISGFMGKTETVERSMGLSTDAEEVWRYFLNCDRPENEIDWDRMFYKKEFEEKGYTRWNRQGIFIEKLTDIKKREVYLYGFKNRTIMNEIALPIYIQILDMVNIMIYNLSKKIGGEVIFRKTDEITVLYPTYKIEYSEEWGGYRKVDFPTRNWKLGMRLDRGIETPIDKVEWNKYKPNNSNDWKDIVDIVNDNKGLLIEGRAGTGKSFIVMKSIEEEYKLNNENTIKMSFTNKASVNIGGSTIHKTLHLNKSEKLTRNTMDKLRKYKYCVIDEIGMIKKNLWKILVAFKKSCPNIIFILMGDWRQLPPIDEDENQIDIFNGSTTKFLCNNGKIELTTRQRYDEELWDFLEKGYDKGVWEGLEEKKVKVEEFIEGINICYYNKTRNIINIMCMDYMIQNRQYKTVEFNNEFDAKGQLQKIYLYKGLPLMCIENCKSLGIVNSNEFVVKSYDDDKIILEGDEDIEIDYKQLEKLFYVNYGRTVHKSQGSTFKTKTYLWDWDRIIEDIRVAYTACSRATLKSNLIVCRL